jgi:hypothetical protein
MKYKVLLLRYGLSSDGSYSSIMKPEIAENKKSIVLEGRRKE